MKKQLLTVSAWTLLSQVAAFGKVWLTAKLFGVGPEIDGYNLGFMLPVLISGTLSGFLQTGLFPVYAKLRAGGDNARVEQFERLILMASMAVAVIVAVPLAIESEAVAAMLARDSTAAVRQWTAFVLPWAASVILMNGISDYLGYVMALRGRYDIAVAAPIANAVLGILLLVAWPEGGMLNLTLGTIAGLLLQVFICYMGAKGAGFRLIGPSMPIRCFAPEFKQVAQLGAWILPGVAFANLTATLPTIFVAKYGEGAVSAFGYAYRLHQSTIQLLVLAASPMILAHFSHLIAQEDWARLRALLSKAGRFALVIGVGGWLGVVLFGERMLEIVFGYGRFDAEAVSRVATQWAWLTLGLAPAIYGNVLVKCLQALARPRVISLLAFSGLAAFIGMTIGIGNVLNERAVAAAIAASSFLVTVLAWLSVESRIRPSVVGRG